jgi:hypothetical protein
MAQILVPGVAQVVMKGTISGHAWANIFHFKLDLAGQNWSISQLNALCQGLFSGAETNMAPHWGVNVICNEVSGVDIGVSAPATGISSGAPFPGTDAIGNELSPQIAVVVSFEIPDRYRGGHPRAYMPPGTSSNLTANEDEWIPAYVGQYSTAVANMFDAAFAAQPGCFQCAVRYTYSYTPDDTRHKFIKTRTGVEGTPQVFNWIAKAPLGTQRRRVSIAG